ncbi:unnamed protein product [Ectocarpus fasciculatus]
MSNGDTVRISQGICAMGEETGHQSPFHCAENSTPALQPPKHGMPQKKANKNKRKRQQRDVQPAPRKSARLIAKAEAAALAISPVNIVIISNIPKKKIKDQSNPDHAVSTIGTPRSSTHAIGKQEEPSVSCFDKEEGLTPTELMEAFGCTDYSKPDQVASAIGRPPSSMHATGKQEEPSDRCFDEERALMPTEPTEMSRCIDDDSKPDQAASTIGRPPAPMHEPSVNCFGEETPTEMLDVSRCTIYGKPDQATSAIGRPASPMQEEPNDSCFDETKALTSMDLMEASRCTDDEGEISTTTQPELLPVFLLAFLHEDQILDGDGEKGWVMDAKEGKVMDAVKAIQDAAP